MTKKIRTLTAAALMTAVLCVLGPVSVPIGPVPISLTNLTIYLFLYLLDTKTASVSYLVYLLLGLAGMPVFSGYSGGAQKLFGPTGGYLIGFLPMTVLAGFFISRYRNNRLICIAALEGATWIPYMLGTIWLSVSTGMSFGAALAAGVLPFIFIDLAKMVLCAVVGPEIRRRLDAAGVS